MERSNLPPGCSSPDGGIDHAMEAALDELSNLDISPNTVAALIQLAPVIERIVNLAYFAGASDGKAEAILALNPLPGETE